MLWLQFWDTNQLMGLPKVRSSFMKKMNAEQTTLKAAKKTCIYLLQHFCSPGGTVLDISNDSKGTKQC